MTSKANKWTLSVINGGERFLRVMLVVSVSVNAANSFYGALGSTYPKGRLCASCVSGYVC